MTVNGGSSSIKFALFDGSSSKRILTGSIDRIGQSESVLRVNGQTEAENEVRSLGAGTHLAAVDTLIDWVEEHLGRKSLAGVGHRVVHGGPDYSEPAVISSRMIEGLRRLTPFDPEHLPREIAMIEAFARRFPDLPQVACFDTAFHRAMPRVAQLLPVPRRFEARGVRRYGFHGLSYTFLMEELERQAGTEAARGRTILAHLGSGASLAAVRDRRPVDTSMGFTPASGLPMSTRSGDLDPGLVSYFAHLENMDADGFNKLVNFQSGLLGVSETSADIRDLLERETDDVRSAEAVALFCYQVRKWIGAFAAVLGGLDTLVFAGGIGENMAQIRHRICDGLAFLGVEVDADRNAAHASVISVEARPVKVRVIRTDEELIIARSVARVLNLCSTQDT